MQLWHNDMEYATFISSRLPEDWQLRISNSATPPGREELVKMFVYFFEEQFERKPSSEEKDCPIEKVNRFITALLDLRNSDQDNPLEDSKVEPLKVWLVTLPRYLRWYCKQNGRKCFLFYAMNEELLRYWWTH